MLGDMMRADWARSTGKLLATASVTAMLLAAPGALAATYTAGNASEFTVALTAANADSDASSTIKLTGSFAMPGLVAIASKPIKIDTQGFTFAATTLRGGWELFGNVTGGDASLNLTINNGGFLTNNGTITGYTTRAGAAVSNASTLVNNGTITGGSSGTNGAFMTIGGGSIINNGLIQGSAAPTAAGGGVLMQVTGGAGSLVNNASGTIRGATSGDGTVGGAGVRILGVAGQTLTNYGLIEGGFGAVAIGSTVNGATIINAGTLRAGSGASAILVTGGVANATTVELRAGSIIYGNVVANAASPNDTLRLAGDANWTLDGGIGSASQYQNFEKLQKTGASTWTVGGSGDFAGATDVLAGKLVVNGSLAGSTVTVASGATLGGSGTVGATTIQSGGIIAPGNSIGTLTVNGAFTQAAGSTYQVEVDPGTATSDRIAVNGAATLATGAAFTIVNYTGAAYQAGQRYTILTATGGLTGNYGLGEQVLTPFFNMRDSYDANNAYLTVMRNATSVGSVGGTPNEVQVGNSVDSLPAGNTLQNGILSQISNAAARQALGQLSGEIHASARTALIDESWALRNAANDRLRAAFGGVGAPSMVTMNYGYTADLSRAVKGPMPALPADRFALWGQGYGGWGRTSSDGNASTMSRSTGGFLLGGDVAAFDNLRFGVLAGYSRSNFDVTARASSGESDNYHLGLYGGGQWGALSLRAGASYTWHDVSTSRLVTAAYLGGNPRADYDAATAQVFGEVGYRMGVGGLELEPFAGLAYVNLHTGRFAETGAVTALSASGDDTSIGYSTLGLRASTSLAFGGTDLTLRGGLAWRHAFGDVKPSVTMAFAGSTPFTISGLPIARDAAVIEAGADMAIGRNATLGLAYNGQLGQDTQDHSFKGVLAVKF